MTTTLIGSRATYFWYTDARMPTGDWDYLSDEPEQKFYPFRPSDRIDMFVDERLGLWNWGSMATPSELYTIKISHAFWEINGPANWNKHANDIIFLSRKQAKFIRPLYDTLLPIWKEKYAKHKTNLSQDKGDFFADAVKRKYDHDSVHRSVAYGDRPLYERILKDGETVAVDNSKFWAMDFETKLKLVREEIYTTALERILIPGNYRGSPGAAYYWALRRTATSLFKGDWALFLMLNLDRLRKPDGNYMKHHLNNEHKLILTGDVDDLLHHDSSRHSPRRR